MIPTIRIISLFLNVCIKIGNFLRILFLVQIVSICIQPTLWCFVFQKKKRRCGWDLNPQSLAGQDVCVICQVIIRTKKRFLAILRNTRLCDHSVSSFILRKRRPFKNIPFLKHFDYFADFGWLKWSKLKTKKSNNVKMRTTPTVKKKLSIMRE
jgi:hypothetical protein